MSILLRPASRSEQWMSALADLLPDEDLVLWPDVDSPDDVEFVLAWSVAAEDLLAYKNLTTVFSLGAGVDQWLPLQQHPALQDVSVVRLVDPAMADEMAAFALHWVLHFQRSFDQLAKLQAEHRFEQPDYVAAEDYSIGILGYGNIGRRIGDAFAQFGYAINGWSRSTPKEGSGASINHFAGLDKLDGFLAASSAVVNVLPNTAATTGLLSKERLAQFAQDAVFVNVGRGTVVDENDLVDALDNGPLRVAVLDVTDPEPPAADSPLFDHPAVVLTGHAAGATIVSSAARLIAANIERIRSGKAAFPLLDPERGY